MNVFKAMRVLQKIFTFFLVLISLFSTSITSVAEESDIDRLIHQGILDKPDTYTYNHVGRNDPFKPFLSPITAAPIEQDPNEIIENNQELSGMQLFEPGQLTLVGVLLSPSQEIAFVEDQSKKGYTLKVGTLIGKRGIISKIELDKIIIEETAKTRSGQEIKNTVFMKLNKDGDK